MEPEVVTRGPMLCVRGFSSLVWSPQCLLLARKWRPAAEKALEAQEEAEEEEDISIEMAPDQNPL